MRLLKRKRTTGIPKAFRGSDRVAKTLQLLKSEQAIQLGELEKHEFRSTWSPCKQQLHRESHNKCAYCEAPTTLVAYGDVEHYRPKSKYWWLAYCYDNYLASCTLCNQKYKKAKFQILNSKMSAPIVRPNDNDATLRTKAAKITPDPYSKTGGMSWAIYEAAHHAERPLLLNPYFDDPMQYVAWQVDHSKGYVKLAALNATDAFQQKMVAAMERDFGINRKELCVHRYDVYLIYVQARLMSEDTEVPDHWRTSMAQQRNKYLRPEKAFSGMLQYFEAKASRDLSLPEN